MDLRRGVVLADKYRIERVLGRGGMGVVVAATHLQLGTQVALKFLHEELVTPQCVQRFLRESRALAALRGDHVCRIADVGMHEGVPYMVMEMLEGADLATILRRETRLPAALAADYVQQACIGIAEAHAIGIVHRDLKPANLFLTQMPDGSGRVKVLDFGVATAPGDDYRLTQTSNLLGSPAYMSPEQLRSSKSVDRRTDIWALGSILFELISGRPPFQGEAPFDLMQRIVAEPTPTLPLGPRQLDTVIGRCLAKNPDERYQDVAQLCGALAPFTETKSRDAAAIVSQLLRRTGSPSLEATAEIPAQPVATTMRSMSGQVIPSAPRRLAAIGAAAAIAAGAAVAIVLTTRDGDAPTATPATAPPPPEAQGTVEPPPPPPQEVKADPPAIEPDAAIPEPTEVEVASETKPKKPARKKKPTKRSEGSATTTPPAAPPEEDLGARRK